MRNVLVEISVTEKPLPSGAVFADYFVQLTNKASQGAGFVTAEVSTSVQFRGIPEGDYTVQAFARDKTGQPIGEPLTADFQVLPATGGGGGGGGAVQTYLAPTGLNVLVV
jgi:hypothetical protein